MGVNKVVRDLATGLTQGCDGALEDKQSAKVSEASDRILWQEAKRVHKVLKGARVTEKSIASISESYRKKITKTQSVEDLVAIRDEIQNMMTAIKCFSASKDVLQKENWQADSNVASSVAYLESNVGSLLMEIEWRLLHLSGNQLYAISEGSCGELEKSQWGLLQQDLDDTVRTAEGNGLMVTSQFKKDVVERGCKFQTVTVGDQVIQFENEEQERARETGKVKSVVDAIQSFTEFLPHSFKESGIAALQNLVTQSIITRSTDPLVAAVMSDENFSKIAACFTEVPIPSLIPDGSSSSIEMKLDPTCGGIDVRVSTVLVGTVSTGQMQKELARGAYEINVKLVPAETGESKFVIVAYSIDLQGV